MKKPETKIFSWSRASTISAIALAAHGLIGCTGDIEPLSDEVITEVESSSNEVRGGTDAAAEPWLVSMQVLFKDGTWRHHCAGTLIDEEWMLTAAHCVKEFGGLFGIPLTSLRGCVGVQNLNQCTSANTIRFSEIKRHYLYAGGTSPAHDIALMKLSAPTTAPTTALATKDRDPDAGDNAQLRGWGATNQASVSSVLQRLDYPIVSNQQCAEKWRPLQVIQGSQLCASATSVQGSCRGDSGGPLHFGGVQVGVVSFGATDANTGACNGAIPDVYTRVSAFRPWIDDCLSGSPFCR